MKHMTQDQLKERRIKFIVANVVGLLKDGKVKEAINCSKEVNMSVKDFGLLAQQYLNENK